MAQTYSRTEAAALLGVRPHQITRLLAHGQLKRSAGAKFTAADIAAHVRAKADAPATGTSGDLKLTAAKCRRAERQAAEALCAQVPAAAVAVLWDETKAHVRNAMASLPDMAGALVPIDSANQCQQALTDAVYAALRTASEWPGDRDVPAKTASVHAAKTLREWRAKIVAANTAVIEAGERLRAGEDVLVSKVGERWDDAMGRCRSHLLALPTKVAPLAAVETDPAIIRSIIDDGVKAAVDELE